MIGIYRIKNKINGNCYYGSSKNIKNRWKKHYNQLKTNSHYNTILQRAWNKYGEENFVFEIVEECLLEELLSLEQKFLDIKPEYNISDKSSGGDCISKNPNKRKIIENMSESVKHRYSIMSTEEKALLFSKPLDKNPNWKGGKSISYCEVCNKTISGGSKKCRVHMTYNRKLENNSFFGKKHSEETKKKLSESRKGKKPSNIKPVKIGDIEYESLMEASRQTGISNTTILWRIKSKNKKYVDYKYI